MKRLLLLLFSLFLLTNFVKSQTFTDVISSSGLNSSRGYICDFIDYNSDGYVDIIYTYQGGAPELYRNNGDLTFTNVHALSGLPAIANTTGIAVADYNNDNNEDVILSFSNGNILVYENNNGVFQDQTSGLGISSLGSGLYNLGISPIQHVLPFDYNQDGYLDLLVSRNNSGKFISVIINTGGNDYSLITDLVSIPGTIDPIFVRVFDFDNDNDDDILYVSKTTTGGINNSGYFMVHPVKLFENSGGIFNDISASAGFSTNVYARAGASFIDFDQDGFMDIIFGSDNCCVGNTGPTIYRNNSDGTFTDITTTLGIDALAGGNRYYWDQTEVDFDNDGDIDFYNGVGADNTTVNNELWVNDGGSYSEQSVAFGLDFTHVNLAAGAGDPYWFDIDNDGDLDVFVRSGNSNSALYINSGSTSNYIAVDPKTCNNLGSVQGVSIAVFDDLGVAHYSSNDRYHGTNGIISNHGIFGLGSATSIDSIYVYWPNGDTTELYNVAVNQTIEVYQVDLPDFNIFSDTTSACGASTTLDAGTDPAWASYLWNTTEDTQTISVSDPGLYTVEVTDTNGCIGYDTTLVSIIDPTIDQIDTNICIGDSLILEIMPGNSCLPLPANLQNGLVGHWPFCGNANDESGNGNDGTVNGATLTSDRFGNPNSAYSFDGVDDFISCNREFIPVFSTSVWFNINQSQPLNPLIDAFDASWEVQIVDDSIGFITFFAPPGGYNIHLSDFNVQTDSWVHLVLLYDNSVCSTYINGTFFNQFNVDPVGVSNGSYFFGSAPTGVPQFLDGNLDDISIWDRALTPSEIQELYELGSYDITWSTGDTTSSITVQPSTTTTYSVTVSDGISSCVDDVTITVNDPQVDAGVDVDVCNGDNITLSGSGADTYAWSGGVTDGVAFGPTVSAYYYVTGTDTLGCEDNDSVYVMVLQPTTSSITEANCDTYTAPDGTTYTTTGNYTAVIPNAAGCDSTITIDLTITNSSSSSITETVCDTYTAPDGTTYTSSGNYTAVIPNAEGCDSTITIDLIVNYSSTSSIVESVCDTYIAPDGQSYNQTGIYTAIIPNSVGCDSTITIDLTVGNSSTNSLTISECDTYTAPDGTTYTSTGNYTAVIPNAVGCDSTITIDLTITNSSSSSITETVCDTYTAPDGTTYTSSGNYTAVIPNAEGCDSTITIDLTVNALTTLDGGADITVCEGDSVILSGSGAQSYAWNNGVTDGNYFTPTVGTTTYTVTGTDVNGCEDTDDVIVSVSGTPELIITGFSPDCQGESTGSAQADVTGGISPYSFVWSNGSITSVIGGIPAGTYSVTVTDDAGCITSGEVIVTDGTDPCFFVPGGLSPNGDGNNDTWGITGLDNYPDASVMIYNRWGQLLYDVGPDGPPWDGMYLGEELPTADYYYVIDLGNGEVYNGVVTLKR